MVDEDEDGGATPRQWHLDKHDRSTGFQLWTDDRGTTITGSRAVKHRDGSVFTPEEWTVTGSGKRFETLEEAQAWASGRAPNMGTATTVVLVALGLAVVGGAAYAGVKMWRNRYGADHGKGQAPVRHFYIVSVLGSDAHVGPYHAWVQRPEGDFMRLPDTYIGYEGAVDAAETYLREQGATPVQQQFDD